MIPSSPQLIWQVLFFRLLRSQKRLFLFAVMTVSLGVALALGIRLGTESATRSLAEILPLDTETQWSAPITAQGTEALLFIRERALRQSSQVFSLVEAQATRHDLFAQRKISFRIVFPWTGSSTEVNQGHTCESEFANFHEISIAGRVVQLRLKSISSSISQNKNCRLAQIDNKSVSRTSELSSFLSEQIRNAPVQVIFRLASEEEKLNFAAFVDSARQIPGIEITNEQKRLDRLKDVTRSFRTNLQLMGFIALFIGFAIVHHVFSLIIARQSRTLATLSALGVSRKKQIKILFALAILLGFISSTLGTLFGLIAGYFLSGVTSETIQNLYESFVDSSHVYWQTSDLIYSLFLGMFACILGALQPILKIFRLPIAASMREGGFESQQTGLSTKQTLQLTVVLTLATVLLLRWTYVWNRIPISALVACLGLLLITALIAKLLTYGLYRANRLTEKEKKWRKEIRLYLPPQSAVVVQVLTLTFTLTFGVKGMAESFRKTVLDWTQSTLSANLWIRANGQGNRGSLSDEILTRLENSKSNEALAVDTLSIVPAFLSTDQFSTPKPILYASARLQEQAKVTPLHFLIPENSKKELQASIAKNIAESALTCLGTEAAPCLAYISEPVQVHFNLSSPLEKTLCPVIQNRRICFRIQAVYQDFGSDQGVILSDQNVIERLLGERVSPSFANVYLKSSRNTQTTTLEADLRNFALISQNTVSFETRRDLQHRILETFDDTFRVTDALYILSGIIAIIATISCLNLQIQLRRREWMIQWTLGLGRNKFRKRFALWSSVMAILAALVSIAGGTLLSYVLVYVVNYYSFGYSLSLFIPWNLPLALIMTAAVSGYLSGFWQGKNLDKIIANNRFILD